MEDAVSGRSPELAESRPGVFGVVFANRAYLSLLYMMVSAILGFVYFCLIFLLLLDLKFVKRVVLGIVEPGVHGVASAIGFVVGIAFITLLVFALLRPVAWLDRVLIRSLLGRDIVRTAQRPPSNGFFGYFRSVFSDAHTWTSLSTWL
ncbi:MAG: sensor domain-containing protein [Proteobacteria bacterium]|nr:sensor domain-containing protein [Pseudomonadota bacterium]